MTELEKLACEYVQAVDKEYDLRKEYFNYVNARSFDHKEAAAKADAYHAAEKVTRLAYGAMASHVRAAYL